MKKMNVSTIGAVAAWALAGVAGLGQTVGIGQLSRNGELLGTNLQPGSVASVEWAPTVLGPWTNNWTALSAVTVDSNGTLRVAVPMFYRLRGQVWGSAAAPTGMVNIPAGSFQMGNCKDPGEGWGVELPVHTVTVGAFYMDKNLVTKALWDTVYTWATNHGYRFDNRGDGKADNHPVQRVSWDDAVKWCNARSELEGRVPAYYTSASLTTVYRTVWVNMRNDWVKWNGGYRLPTEAEWEYAARGGLSGKRFPWGDTITHSQANYSSDAGYAYDLSPTRGNHPAYAMGGTPYTSPVGSFAANGYGLFDMTGNVFELCWDRQGNYSSASQTDPHGPDEEWDRVIRGGSWWSLPIHCRVSFRDHWASSSAGYYLGFRTVLSPGQ